MPKVKKKKLEAAILEPTPEWLSSKTELFGFEPSEAGKDALRICGLRRKLKEVLGREWIEVNFGLPIPGPELELLPILRERERFTHIVKPRSLDHLKDLAGVPNGAVLNARKLDPCTCPQWPVRSHLLPGSKKFSFNRLNAEQRQAVHDMANNLVYGYADPEMVSAAPVAGVADYVLRRAAELPVFAIKDLIVCDGESVHFNGWATLYFHNVIVEGDGEIRLGNHTKLHAYNFERV